MSTMKMSHYLVIHRQANARCKAITFRFTKYLTLLSTKLLLQTGNVGWGKKSGSSKGF